jgi:hypothetical protein
MVLAGVLALGAVGLGLSVSGVRGTAPPPPAARDAPAEPGWGDDPLHRVSAALVSWWPGDGHAFDLAGDNHAERAEAVRFEKGRAGLAFSFLGGRGQAVTARQSALKDSFTLALWVHPKGLRSPPPAWAIPTHVGVSGQRYAVYPAHGGNEGKRAGCGFSAGTNGVGLFEHTHDNCPCVIDHAAPLKGWLHVAAVYSGGRPTLYVDGKAVKTGVRSRWTVFPGTTFGDPSDGYGPFQGLVDEVTLFNRALSAEEVTVLMRATRGVPGRLPLSGATFARLWSCLAGKEAPQSLFAVHRLAASGDEAVRLLRPHLKPSRGPAKPTVAELLKQLDDDSFAVRERATRTLLERAAAAPRLRAALRGKPSLEVRRRIEQILRKLPDPRPTPADLRMVRAAAALARIDTPASRKLLAEMAGGPDSLAASAAEALLAEAGASSGR